MTYFPFENKLTFQCILTFLAHSDAASILILVFVSKAFATYVNRSLSLADREKILDMCTLQGGLSFAGRFPGLILFEWANANLVHFRGFEIHNFDFTISADHNNFEIIDWFCKNRLKASIDTQLDKVIKQDRLDILTRFPKQYGDYHVFEKALQHHSLHIVKYMLDIGFTLDMVNKKLNLNHVSSRAGLLGNFEMVEFLLHSGFGLSSATQGAVSAARRNNISHLRFLEEEKIEFHAVKVAIKAAKHGHFRIVEWCHARKPFDHWDLINAIMNYQAYDFVSWCLEMHLYDNLQMVHRAAIWRSGRVLGLKAQQPIAPATQIAEVLSLVEKYINKQ